MDIRYQQAVDFLSERLGGLRPRVGIILGSGLGGLAERIEQPIRIDYHETPHMPASTAPGHVGRFVAGMLGGMPVLCMQGRLHPYEGHPIAGVAFPVRVMKLLGVQTLIATNAAGGINTDFSAGDLMLIRDHINFMGENPLVGPNEADFGPRFCDMSYTYTPALCQLAREEAQAEKIPLHEGVYLACKGPNYETPAEIRAFRTLGADAVGMSTVPEVLAAAHCGMQVLAFSLVTNMAAGVLDQKLSEQEVIEMGERRGAQLQTLVARILRRMREQMPD